MKNLIDQSVKDNEIFQERYPDVLVDGSYYVERMADIQSFTGKIPAPEKGSNVATTEINAVSFDKTCNMLDELISQYNKLKEALSKSECFSYAVSAGYLLSAGVYDKRDMRAHQSFDTSYTYSGYGITSRVTFVLSLISSHLEKNNDNATNLEITNKISTLLFTIAKIFHPQVVSDLFSVIWKNPVEYLFSFSEDLLYSIEKQLYETLVMREGVLYDTYGEKYFKGMGYVGFRNDDFVAEKLAPFVFRTAVEILDDTHNWFGTIFNPPVYNLYRKSIYTDILKSMVVYDKNEMVNANRFIRKQVTEWIKTLPIESRPECPNCYKYIDIESYLIGVYETIVRDIPDMNKYISAAEAEKERTEADYNSVKAEIDAAINGKEHNRKELLAKLKETEEAKKQAYDVYLNMLKYKSLAAFLFEEIFSNEKMINLSVSEDLFYYILTHEPGEDNAMHDVHNLVAALVCKRDFKPTGIPSINPYYLHTEEQDLASENTHKFARVFAGLVNYNMGSRIACACIDTPVEAGIMLSNLEYTVMTGKLVLANQINSKLSTIMSYLKSYYDASEDQKSKYITDPIKEVQDMLKQFYDGGFDFDVGVPESRNDLVVNINLLIKVANEKEAAYVTGATWYSLLNSLKEDLVGYEDIVWGSENILSQVRGIFQRFGEQESTDTAKNDIGNGHRITSLWPRNHQWEFPIVDNDKDTPGKSRAETDHENYYDLKPGDIKTDRFKTPYEQLDDRFTTSKACD